MKMPQITARDVIALFCLISAFILKWQGIDGELDIVIAAIIGYYFSKRVYEESNIKPL